MQQKKATTMNNYLISEAIGDIAGSAYEGKAHRIKDYDKVKLFSTRAHFTDDTVLTFACAEAFIDGLDMTMNLWKCANEHRHAGFSSTFKKWFASHKPQPYRSLGNGSAMRCSSAGWLATSEQECIRMATETAIICFLDSKDYVDCIKLAISLGGDADTLAAIAGPMAYAYYKKMPDALVCQAMKMLPDWMVDVSERFDEFINRR